MSAYLTSDRAARHLSITRRTLSEWRRTGGGPRYIRLGSRLGRVRYRRDDLDAWMADRVCSMTAAEAGNQ